jgi:hypothetical protein
MITPKATIPSTIDLRDYWSRQGVPWREVLDLHCSIIDRLRASSSWWSS